MKEYLSCYNKHKPSLKIHWQGAKLSLQKHGTEISINKFPRYEMLIPSEEECNQNRLHFTLGHRG